MGFLFARVKSMPMVLKYATTLSKLWRAGGRHWSMQGTRVTPGH